MCVKLVVYLVQMVPTKNIMIYRNNSPTLRNGLFSTLITKVFIITGTLSSVKKKIFRSSTAFLSTEVSVPRSNINADVKQLNVTNHLKVDNAIKNQLNQIIQLGHSLLKIIF